jgi:2-polyprenyl-6-methoxyphenol hydroxylase-like FAD-dependent oxidoreductase
LLLAILLTLRRGLCAVGGILDIALPKHIIDEPSMVFFMGATGVFGYSGLTQTDHRKLLFWSVYQTELPRRDLRLDYDLLTKQLKERHSGWGDPIIQQCLDNATIDNIYPIFIMPDLPHWGRDGCLLIGDAAHALPPRSGQGSSQAFEDANTVGLLLAGLMENHAQEGAIPLLVKGVYDIRHDRVKVIRNQALRFKDPKMPMSLAMKWFLWTSMFIMTKLLYIYKLLGAIDTWDAKEEVKRYLGG